MDKSQFTKDYKVLLELLKSARQAADLTQIELADRLETTQSIVSKCERGERRLDVVELRNWCFAIGISWLDFLHQVEAELQAKAKPRPSRKK